MVISRNTEMLATVLLVLTLSGAHASIFGDTQRLCVKGTVQCSTDARHQTGQIVKLWDDDTGIDDLMGEATTDGNGEFEICGTASDPWGDIDPVLEIYTTCNNAEETEQGCYRKLPFHISPNYIANTYDLLVDLADKRPDETRKCLTGNRLNDFVKQWSGKSSGEWLKSVTGDEGVAGFFRTVKDKGSQIWTSITNT